MKIRSKSGDEIDLAEVRAYLSQQLAWKQVTLATNLLDALEAALGVAYILGSELEAYDVGYNDAISNIRQAVCLIENEQTPQSARDIKPPPMHTCQGGASIFAHLCLACNRDMDRGEPHTAECASALEQDGGA